MSFGDDSLDGLSCGDTVDVVVMAVCDELYKGLWHGDRFIVKGLGAGIWSLFGYRLTGKSEGIGYLESTEHSLSVQKQEIQLGAFLTLKETCSGLGGISAGAYYAGLRTTVFNDKAGIACQTISLNGGRVIEGDVSHRDIRQAISQQDPHGACLLTAGFPCNSYSPQGGQGGLRDPRGQVLLSVLRLAWQMQVAGLVLECVPEVQDHVGVGKLLEEFATRMGMQKCQIVIDLGEQWISKRCRWWCVMVPANLPLLELQPWGHVSPKPVIRDEVQSWPAWPLSQEQALAWTAEEQQMYEDTRFGTDPRRLDLHAQAPTALHSYGSAMRPCPCGCRTKGFAFHTLLHRGLRGFGIFFGGSSGS